MLRLLRLLQPRAARAAARRSRSLGIALGVALGYGVHLVNRAAVDELAAAVRSLAGEADLEVRGGRAGFPEALYPRIARLAGRGGGEPGARAGRRHRRHRAHDRASSASTSCARRCCSRSSCRRPRRAARAGSRVCFRRRPPRRSAWRRARAATRGRAGDRRAEGRRRATPRCSGMSALTDIATAQWRLGRLGELNRIDLRLAAGAGPRSSCSSADRSAAAAGRARRVGRERWRRRAPIRRAPTA